MLIYAQGGQPHNLLFEGACLNSRNPDPWRGVNPGPEWPGLTPFPLNPVNPLNLVTRSGRLDFAVIYNGLATFSRKVMSNFQQNPEDAPMQPKASQRDPKHGQGSPRPPQREPQGAKGHPKGSHREPKVTPKEPKKLPKRAQDGLEGVKSHHTGAKGDQKKQFLRECARREPSRSETRTIRLYRP